MDKIIKYRILGLMSGSSLDGVDLAVTAFEVKETTKGVTITDWKIEERTTVPYPSSWVERLQLAPHLSGFDLTLLDIDLGHYFGGLLHTFIAQLNIKPDCISSHGHTIFHYPEKKMTLQVGAGPSIAAITGIDTYDNFRLQDMAAGGQGAPLSPIVDKFLFPDIKYTLNLGGIANINIKNDQQYVAYDICGANQILNALAAEIGKTYDEDGLMAKQGNIIPQLLEVANRWDYLHLTPPKSLGNNQVQQQSTHLFKTHTSSVADRLHTACQHIAYQVAKSIQSYITKGKETLLISGGGAHNSFLIQCIKSHLPSNVEVVIPEKSLIDYKECVLMSLLALLNHFNLPTIIGSVTGAKKETIGGCFHKGITHKKYTH